MPDEDAGTASLASASREDPGITVRLSRRRQRSRARASDGHRWFRWSSTGATPRTNQSSFANKVCDQPFDQLWRSTLADEAEVIDVDVVGGAGHVDLPLHAEHLARVDVGLARLTPALHLLHVLEGEGVAGPLLGELQVHAEVVEALATDAAFRIGVAVRHLQADLIGRGRA